MTRSSIRVLLFQEKTGWIAQCLEYDISAQGNNMKDAMLTFRDIFVAQIARDMDRGIKPLSMKKQAPPWYWQRLKEAEPLKNPVALKLPHDGSKATVSALRFVNA